MKKLSLEEKEFIKENIEANTTKLLLQPQIENIDIKLCVRQIEGYRKAIEKFPSLIESENIIFPKKINLEQTSSEQTAKYKASLFPAESTLRDLTSGFGIDDIFFAKKIKKVYYHEIDIELAEVALSNFETLNLNNIEVIKGNSLNNISNLEETDIIYIDPSRRNENQKKVFLLEDCQPYVVDLIPKLFEKTKTIALKLSPMLEIKSLLNELINIKEIHTISVKNECKELFVILEKGFNEEIKYHCIDFDSNNKLIKFSFNNATISPNIANKNDIKRESFLYEPNASVMKAGGYHVISEYFPIKKIASRSHLFVSEQKIDNFPGRTFIITTLFPYNHKNIKTLSERFPKANITIRNFPQMVAEIRKRTGIKDGGDDYLFFTTNSENEKIIIACEKLS
ncbi:MAG: class I SAM-dependent methyltransferase [Bacteroidales bacterium]|nr:class I SAM-dependent methyltransferase [Bacteroidales bacterium]